jgi:hypothetical protein
MGSRTAVWHLHFRTPAPSWQPERKGYPIAAGARSPFLRCASQRDARVIPHIGESMGIGRTALAFRCLRCQVTRPTEQTRPPIPKLGASPAVGSPSHARPAGPADPPNTGRGSRAGRAEFIAEVGMLGTLATPRSRIVGVPPQAQIVARVKRHA